MAIYGFCPRWEDFYLVVCDVCKQSVKPQALKQHMELRHGGIVTPTKQLTTFQETSASSSRSGKSRNKNKINPVVKIERTIQVNDEYRESAFSRLQASNPNSVCNAEPSEPSTINIHNLNPTILPISTREAINLRPTSAPSIITTSGSTNPGIISSNLTRIPTMSEALQCNYLSTHSTLSHSNSIKAEIKLEDRLDGRFELRQTNTPPQVPTPTLPPPAPPEPQHTLPHSSNHAGPSPSIGPPSIESQCIGPPSVGSHSLGPHSIGPPSIGPPSVGPPSVGPPSVGSSGVPSRPSSVSGAPVIHSVSMGSSMSSSHMVSNVQSMNLTSQEEEVNRISAMLQKEVEAFASKSLLPGLGDLSSGNGTSIAIHDVVEAQGHAGGGLTNVSMSNTMSTNNLTGLNGNINLSSPSLLNNANNRLINTTSVPVTPTHMVAVSQSMGSVPVPMSHMSIATLNQIQADLLATVSESDLNAVLNATPDNSEIPQSSVLPNNSQCYLNENGNIQFSDQQTITNDQLFETNNLGSQNVLQHQFSSDQLSMPVLEQIAGEVLADSQNLEIVPNTVVQGQYSNSSNELLEVPVDSINFSDVDKMSQCDELSNAVNSITQLCQQSNSGLESQLVGFLQQQTTTPASSPNNSSISSIQNASIGASPTTISTPPNSQGITVVIGSGSQMTVSNIVSQSSINMPALTASLKKPTLVTTIANGNHMITGLSSASNRTVSHINNASTATIHHQHLQQQQQQTQSHHVQQIHIHSQQLQQQTQQDHPQIQQHYQIQQTQHLQSQQQTISQAQQTQTVGTLLTQTIQTQSPKKSSKKKKPGERKLVPLKDREYNPELHCGVLVAETGKPCTRSLTCKTHSLTLRRQVADRSKKFDELLLEHRAAKEAQQKASRPAEAAATQFQASSSRNVVVASSAGLSSVLAGQTIAGHTAALSSPLLARTLVGLSASNTSGVIQSDPSPTSHLHPMDPPGIPSHPLATPPSPAHWSAPLRLVPPLSHSDHFYVKEQPKPIHTCSFNARRLGGYIATDHRMDSLRSAFRNALKKPHSSSTILSECILSNNATINGPHERFNNVKPLLARKLQASVPSSSGSKESIGITTGYNGHIQMPANSVGIMNSTLAAALKRPTQQETLKANIPTIASAKNKNKKVKTNEGAINFVSNVVQLDASGNKNHIPVVAVSLPNGLTNTQTITLGNVAITSMRNSANQPFRIQPSMTVRDAQVGDGRTGAGDNANIVLGSGIPAGTGIVIDTNSIKSFKSDTLRLEGPRIVTNVSKGNTALGTTTVVGSSSIGTTSAGTVPPGSVYFTVPSSSNTHYALQQVLNRLQVQSSKGGGVKLLSSNPNAVAGGRPAYVLQQEKEPS